MYSLLLGAAVTLGVLGIGASVAQLVAPPPDSELGTRIVVDAGPSPTPQPSPSPTPEPAPSTGPEPDRAPEPPRVVPADPPVVVDDDDDDDDDDGDDEVDD